MRTWLIRLSAIALLVGLAFAARTERAFACTCGGLTPLEVLAYDEFEAVFAGEVIAGGGYNVAVVEFQVSRVWKGDLDATEVMRKGGLGTTCDFGLEVGKEYLAYAYRDQPGEPLKVDLCTTPLLEYAYEELDLDARGPGQPPGTGAVVPGQGRVPQPPGTGTSMLWEPQLRAADGWVVALLVVATLALAGAGFATTVRRARHG